MEALKYAPHARSEGIPEEDHCPDLCIVDMATIIHSAPPTGRRGKTGDAMQFTEWKEYCAHVTKHFIIDSCARGGAKAARHPEVILCFDKRSTVPPVKAFGMRSAWAMGVQFPRARKVAPSEERAGRVKGLKWSVFGRTISPNSI